MSKSSGMGDNFYVSGYDLSGDTNSLSAVRGSLATLDVTDITQSAYERLGGERDGELAWVSYFNPAAGQAHTVLSALPTGDVIGSYFRGTTLGNPAFSLTGKLIDYPPNRGKDGSLTFKCQVLANAYGGEWGVGLTAGKRTDTSATNGTSVDQTTVSTSFGWQAWLHVFSFAGTSVTVSVQDSADNSSFTTISGASFTAATGVTSQRLQASSSTATVRRYVRAITTGTFSSAVFAVVFTRNLTATTF